VIDTDPGIDDALALLLAWSSPELLVEALTTVAGNVPVAQATLNAFRLCELRRPRPMPIVAEGAATPLDRALRTATHYHGDDGLGDAGGWPEPAARPVPADALDVLLEAMRRHRERLLLIALGPLTNVAQALRRDAAAVRGVGRIVVMGGAVDVRGNVEDADAEFNIHVDPAAAREVIDAGLPIDLVPLDATRQAVLRRAELGAALARHPGPIADRVAAFTAHGFRERGDDRQPGLTLHDPLAVAVAFEPSLVTWEAVRLTIGPEGETRRAEGAPNCRIARRVDRVRVIDLLLDRVADVAP
jgi:purine nucleosidase/pyrimidine-specific ribonucleoside hydrolase